MDEANYWALMVSPTLRPFIAVLLGDDLDSSSQVAGTLEAPDELFPKAGQS